MGFTTVANILRNNNPLDQKEKTYSKNYRSKSTRPVNNSFDFLSLIEKWPEIIGDRLSKQTIPLKNVNTTLTILTDHPILSQQLSFMELEIKEKVFRTFPNLRYSIKQLNFQVNSGFFKERHGKAAKIFAKDSSQLSSTLHPFSPTFKRLKKCAESEFADVEDAELKEMLISLYIQNESR